MTSITVNFGGKTVNVKISEPTLNSSGTISNQTGASNVTTTCTCPFSPGNGIGQIDQVQNPIPVAALEPVQPFVAVVMGVGGMLVADILTPDDRGVVLGINLVSVTGGQVGSVAWSGPIVNNINGTGGWNFVLNQPVYIGANGVITQTPPVTGWQAAIGYALSQNSIMFRPETMVVSPNAIPTAPVVNVVPYAPAISLDFDSADVFDLTLTGNPTLAFTSGTQGRVVTLRVRQDSVGGHQTVNASNIKSSNVLYTLMASSYVVSQYQRTPAGYEALFSTELL